VSERTTRNLSNDKWHPLARIVSLLLLSLIFLAHQARNCEASDITALSKKLAAATNTYLK
jgi:hypothetical protein